ncbi:MAG: hypothetical protein HC837_09775 [Chloroflexaceae bacterium]|nr:hypothetical protein [Chloroflexaceae bacterium]
MDWWSRYQGAFTLPLPPQKAQQLAAYAGRPIILGMRPEHIHDPAYVPPGLHEHARVQALVSVTERMGSEIYVHLERDGTSFVGRFDPRSSVQTGALAEAVLDMQNMYVFDRETEQALL